MSPGSNMPAWKPWRSAIAMKALGPLSNFRPELVLMDQICPRSMAASSGRIQQEAAFLTIPIVFLSGQSDPDKQLELMQIGADELLTKPVNPRSAW